MARRTATFSLSPTTKRKWLKALRSGNFNQTTLQMFNRRENGYCCLGVLCVVEGFPPIKMVGAEFPTEVGMFLEVIPTPDEVPPALRQYDLQDAAFSVLYKGRLTPLSQLNDSAGLSFAKIADIIEKRVPTH